MATRHVEAGEAHGLVMAVDFGSSDYMLLGGGTFCEEPRRAVSALDSLKKKFFI